MSTKGGAGYLAVQTIIGDETFHAHLHCYQECMEEPLGTVYVDIWEQGIRNNHTTTLTVPADTFRKFARELGAWAAAKDEFDRKQAEKAKGD